ncbi:MAG: hypothetical protein GC137_06345 [Alphaproteobacteria bacterium]|nr:hypothetical protein [Alphaproteobacteria bacterium]
MQVRNTRTSVGTKLSKAFHYKGGSTVHYKLQNGNGQFFSSESDVDYSNIDGFTMQDIDEGNIHAEAELDVPSRYFDMDYFLRFNKF